MKRFLSVLLTLALVLSFAGCAGTPASTAPSTPASGEPASQPAAETEDDKLVFAFIIPGLDANWYVEIVDSFKYAAEEIGAEVLVLPSDYDVDKEVANIDLCD